MNKVSTTDIRAALGDPRFRSLFPELEKEITEFLNNPGCSCNMKLYHKLLGYGDRLKQYFPTKEVETINEKVDRLATNKWSVINCKSSEVEKQLRRLPKGRKQIALARWQDDVTIVVNELDFLF